MADLVPTLSTKSAVYSGIISTEPPMVAASCRTANCSWPVIPTLAACGGCTTIPVNTLCNQTSRTCTHSTPATSVDAPMDAPGYSIFKVAPSNGTVYPVVSTSRAYFSVFELLSASRPDGEASLIEGNECALWFCIQSYSISVNGGIQNESLVGNWSTTTVRRSDSGSRGAEYAFVNIPGNQLNVENGSNYIVTHGAMTALRSFMFGITTGTVYADVSKIDYSSDWVEAMWNASNHLQDWIETFATSMTNEIRKHGTLLSSSQGARYDGHATQLTPIIKVQWRWLIYPCVMILLSVLYLFHTIFASARGGVSVWKSGALPMLFCRVDENILDRMGNGMNEPNGLDEKIGHLPVAMYRGENGQWAFRTTSAEEN
ncbi:hypothetical protein B0T16DRAFT_53546 [Cercophora newfieldiana]|uniref:Uncharacterized protein n=1 Tax=Cercophora newfieldiana TaxID=92897 RepID=A0AA40D0E8_9PEZI|nr:hypothetical protein B0T16DRAFT_53546 [Cercophora newfieldiana]